MQLRPLLAKFDALAAWLQSPLLLVVRLFWGWQFAQDGWGKLTHLDKVTAYFTDLGLPMPKVSATMTGSIECFGGALLAIGLLARPVAVPLLCTMIGAYATAEKESLQVIFSDPDKFLSADPFHYLFAAAIILAFGPGKLSLDALLFRKSAAK